MARLDAYRVTDCHGPNSPRNDDDRHPEEPNPSRHPEEQSDVGIYRCEDAAHREDCHGSKEPRNDGKDKRHPEEQSDVGIYLCEAKRG